MSLKNKLEAVKLFHETFDAPFSDTPIANISQDRKELRFKLMKEENEEYEEAVKNNDIVGIADALGDKLYILCGTIIEHGLQSKIDDVFDEIQRSNMSKLGEDGKPIYREDGKVMKGPNYFTPDIEKILNSENVRAINFGEALIALKEGKRVQRSGWNGKGMYLHIINSGNYGINMAYSKLWEDLRKHDNTDESVLLPWIGLKTADNKFVPWTASQPDVLADDWMIID